MAEAQAATGTPLDKVKVIISKLEDEHHHPRSGRLWVVLLLFTLVEIGWASSLLGLTDRSMEAGQFRDAQKLCQAIVSEYNDDNATLVRIEEVAAGTKTYEPHLLALTGRPGRRIFNMLSPQEQKLFRDFDSGAAGESQSADLAKAVNGFLNREEFYQDKAFAALNVSPAVQGKLTGLRTSSGVSKAFFAFMGEADVMMLNRGLFEKAYPKFVAPPSLPLLLIFGLVGFAVIKMIVVAEFFMHVKYEGIWLRILMIPTSVLAFVVIVFLAPDVGRADMYVWWYEFLIPLGVLIVLAGFVIKKLSVYLDIPADDSPSPH
jgi:hypothetical protein